MADKKDVDPDMLDYVFDDVYYNPDRQGRGETRRRSSILKQTRNINLDICEFEEIEARRKSQNAKRVSFADTFQVKEYPTGNIYDIPGRHELESSKNPSISQDESGLETKKENLGASSREFLADATLSFIDHQEVGVSKENYVGGLAISFLEAEKENIGIIGKYSIPEVPNIKTSSEFIHQNNNFTETSKNYELSQSLQKNLSTKITTSTVSSFAHDPELFDDCPEPTLDDMDITCLPSPKAKSNPDKTKNKTQLSVKDMDITCFDGNDSFDISSSLASNDVFFPKTSFKPDDESNQLILGKLNMFAPVSKSELDLDDTSSSHTFENIKLRSLSSANSESDNRPFFLANTQSLFLDKIPNHSKDISLGLTEEENLKQNSTANRTEKNFSEMSSYKCSGIDFTKTGSQIHDKKIVTSDEICRYSPGGKFMKMVSETENSPNRIQVYSAEKLHFPMPSTAFLENKENVGFNRKRRNSETPLSKLTEVLTDKEIKYDLANPIIKSNRNALNHADSPSESDSVKEIRKPLLTSSTNIFSTDAIDMAKSGCSRKTSLNVENSSNYHSEDLKFRGQKYQPALFDEKSLESPKTPQFEAMELTSIAGNDSFNFINDSFEEKQQQELDQNLNNDKSFALTGSGKTHFNTPDKMNDVVDHKDEAINHLISHEVQLTCTVKTSISPFLNLKKAFPTATSGNCNDMNNSLLFKQKYVFQSNTMDITCNTDSMNFENSADYNPSEDEKFGDGNTELSLHNNQITGHKTCHFESEGLELTCVADNDEFSCINDASFEVKLQDKSIPGWSDPRVIDSSKTHNFTSDKMELTCAVKNCTDFEKTANDEFPFTTNRAFEAKLQDKSIPGWNNPKLLDRSKTHNFTSDKMELTGTVENYTDFEKTANDEFSCINDASFEAKLQGKSIPDWNNPKLLDKSKTHNFTSDNMELTCAVKNYTDFGKTANDEFSCTNDTSFEAKLQGKSIPGWNNPKLLDGSKTHNFISDKMEMTCAVKNYTDFEKKENNESYLNSHRKNLSMILESNQHPHNEAGSKTDSSNILHSLDVGKKNMVSSSMEIEKQYKICSTTQSFPENCNYSLADVSSLSSFQNDVKCTDKTFNSHEMESTLMADKSHKLQMSPFFHLSSHSSISEEKHSFSFQNGDDNFYKKFQITHLNSSSFSKSVREESIPNKNISGNAEENNPHENIPVNSEDNKILQTNQLPFKTDSTSSEDNGNVWDVVLKPLNSKDASIKMPPGLQNFLSRTPGAVYTLRKKRQQTKDFLKECILSPDVKNILRRSEKLSLKRPFSEMKAYNPVSYDHKKSLSFHSYEMEGSFTAGSKENVQLPAVQTLNSSVKATNDNSSMAITSLTPAPTSAFTSFVRPEANLSCQSNKIIREEKCRQNSFQIEDKQKSKNFSFSENDSLQLLRNSVLDNVEMLPELSPLVVKSAARNESIKVGPAKQGLHFPQKVSGLSMGLEENKICLKNSNSHLSLSTNQNEMKLSDPLLCESETFNLKRRCWDENAIQKQEKSIQSELDSLPLLSNSALDNTKTISEEFLPEIPAKSPPKKESIKVQPTGEDLPLKISDLSQVLEKNQPKNSNSHLSLPINPAEMKSKDPLFRCESEALHLKTRCNDQNIIQKQETSISKEHVANNSFNRSTMSITVQGNETESSKETNVNISTNDGKISPKHLDISNVSNKVLFAEKVSKSNVVQDPHLDPKPHLVLTRDEGEGMLPTSDGKVSPKNLEFFRTSNIPSEVTLEEKVDKSNLAPNPPHVLRRNESEVMLPTSDETTSPKQLEFNETSNMVSQVSLAEKVAAEPPLASNLPIVLNFDEDEGISTNDSCSSASDSLQDLDSLKSKFNKGSKGTHWKLKTLNKKETVFELKWNAWLYKCSVIIHVKNIDLGKSDIHLRTSSHDPDDEYESLGYKVFQFLAKDEIVSFASYSDNMIEKLGKYSNIAERVATLMRDILHVSVDEPYILSEDLDPLELRVEVLNDNHVSHFLMIFRVNLQTYPFEKIIPEVKHVNCKDITKDVNEAIKNIKPGKDYLWRMVKAAANL